MAKHFWNRFHKKGKAAGEDQHDEAVESAEEEGEELELDADTEVEEASVPTKMTKRAKLAGYVKQGLHLGKTGVGAAVTAAREGVQDPMHGGRAIKKAMKTIGEELQKPAHEIAADIKAARLAVTDLLVYELRECEALFHQVLLSLADAPDKLKEMLHKVKVEWIPDLVEKCKELVPHILDAFLPAGVKRGARLGVEVGGAATIPAYCVPIAISAKGKVAVWGSMERGDASTVEFEVGLEKDLSAGVGVGFDGPVTAKVGGKVALGLNESMSLKLHLDEVQWTKGFVSFLRSGDYKEAFKNLWDNCTDAIIDASQIGFKVGGTVAVGVEGEVAVPYVSAGAEGKVGLGVSVEYEGSSRRSGGHIEVEGKAFADIEAHAGLSSLPIDSDVGGFIGSVLDMLQASGSFHGEVGARLRWKKLPKEPTAEEIAEHAKGSFEYVEFFLGTELETSLVGNTLKLEAEGGLRFTKESIRKCAAKVNQLGGAVVGDGAKKQQLAREGAVKLLEEILPFDSIALKLGAQGSTNMWMSSLWMMSIPSVGDLVGGGSRGVGLELEFVFKKAEFFKAVTGEKDPAAILAKTMSGKLDEANGDARGRLTGYFIESLKKAEVSISTTRRAGFNVDAGVVQVGVEGELEKTRTFDLLEMGSPKEAVQAMVNDALGRGRKQVETDTKVPQDLVKKAA